jgi:Tfp pilus assembly protein PilP
MKKVIFPIAVLVLAVLGWIYYQKNLPIDPKIALQSSIDAAKKVRKLSASEEETLRLQFAVIDWIATSPSHNPPESLKELTPKYFASVPIDISTGKEFDYRRDGKKYYIGNSTTAAASTIKGAVNSVSLVALNIPAPPPDDGFVYDTAGKRDPFMQFDFSARPSRPGISTPLEQYSLNQLRLTAVILDSGTGPKAIVEDGLGKGYTVSLGTKIGDRNGVIMEIQKNTLKILESYQDFTGKETQTVAEMKIQAVAGGKAVDTKKRR